MKPGPAISTFAICGFCGNAATSACASARGFVRACLASSSAAFVAKSPCSALRVRSIDEGRNGIGGQYVLLPQARDGLQDEVVQGVFHSGDSGNRALL